MSRGLGLAGQPSCGCPALCAVGPGSAPWAPGHRCALPAPSLCPGAPEPQPGPPGPGRSGHSACPLSSCSFSPPPEPEGPCGFGGSDKRGANGPDPTFQLLCPTLPEASSPLRLESLLVPGAWLLGSSPGPEQARQTDRQITGTGFPLYILRSGIRKGGTALTAHCILKRQLFSTQGQSPGVMAGSLALVSIMRCNSCDGDTGRRGPPT